MKDTYEQAITQIFKDEGGFTNEPTDPGGPTNFGITIHDAQLYWKPDATADDVRSMPKSVAENIYAIHYATPIMYDSLPPGMDYAVLDYAINSGVIKSIKTLQEILNVPADGFMGPITVQAAKMANTKEITQKIWDLRLAYDQTLTNLWPVYGRGWTNRINRGRTLSMNLIDQFLSLFQKGNQPMSSTTTSTPTVAMPQIQFDPATFVTDIEQALEAANTLLPALLPVVGAFYPPAAAFTKFLPLLPTVLSAVQQVQHNMASHPQAAVDAVAAHLTPGAPNAPALNG